ncbi:MAG TPA: sulfatase [Candidatus Paceibacterota bacterium]|nr:sulfatase [Verrucomicrobiota bacterium]HOX02835.1 sulfatase [Verrucomicrobiota bacterium]HRZ45587.1 sulfatase [Candidatus Paceibacterota bacterium]
MNRSNRPLRAVLVAAALAALPGPTAPALLEAARPPNIVFVLADDLGWTDVACYGSRYYETPHIDRLAAQGMRFTSGYTCGPNCQPTRAALMSGQYGPRTGVYTVGGIERFNWQSRPLRPVDNVTKLPPETVTVAEALRQAGYATALFGKWHLGDDPEHHPLQQGFDEAVVSMGQHFDFKTNPQAEVAPGTYLADFLTQKAEGFIRRHQDGPFFLCLHHFAVHSPHQAKEPLIGKFRPKPASGGHHSPVYAAMIASVDESVGRMMALLDELGLSPRTLLVFTSDNGGVGGYEREGVQGGSITDNAPLRSGKGSLYEGGIRVPYLFRWPGAIAPGKTCEAPINSVDLYPTLLELAGAKPPAGHRLDGISYLGLLTGSLPPASPRPDLFWHFPGYLGAGANTWRTTPVGAIRSGDWKLMEFFEDGRLELYRLSADLGERRNLAGEQPDRARDLHARMTAWRKAIQAPMPTPNDSPASAAPAAKKRNRNPDAKRDPRP